MGTPRIISKLKASLSIYFPSTWEEKGKKKKGREVSQGILSDRYEETEKGGQCLALAITQLWLIKIFYCTLKRTGEL